MSIIDFNEIQQMMNEKKRVKNLLIEGKSTSEVYIETLEESVRLLEEQLRLTRESIEQYKQYNSLLKIQAKRYEQIIQEKDAIINKMLIESHKDS